MPRCCFHFSAMLRLCNRRLRDNWVRRSTRRATGRWRGRSAGQRLSRLRRAASPATSRIWHHPLPETRQARLWIRWLCSLTCPTESLPVPWLTVWSPRG